ncbi:hypothetical protein MZO42_04905 [Sphingomonas psychrotolerans]|uniref:Thioredoxin domain-containing protein n=1 Tax=Sphingomonas psychrotolerans TaxID=1327635 RepID=A0ABU3N0M8_9SPHN|nr:hypothetical protein [Sphingomonas psychrotolerans]MDT8758028.1 hypothetical protein [Sphingomonas psychrotolerans]
MDEDPRDYLRRTAAAFETLAPPPPAPHDWRWRAERTLADLLGRATVVDYGDLYVMPYVDGQYPDSMVQLMLIVALRDYARATGVPIPLEGQLRKGLGRFFDPEVGTIRRYLPSVGREKDWNAVDSWYLYHPLSNLARLALDGEGEARNLLIDSVEYGVRAARHFGYQWPVMYDIRDLSVKVQALDAGRPGETDCGGLYAYLMTQVHALTGEERWLEEARPALRAADGRGRSLMYQINLTAWGAAACLRLWKLGGEGEWLDRAYYWLANLFHHCDFRARFAGPVPCFMAATCMYNSDYIAPFEDHEVFMALREVLALGSEALDPAARVLAEGFCRHAADRAWTFYPDMLPPEMLAAKQESGRIDRALSFPLEDIYPDGRKAGRVGQEIYGAGAAFLYAAHPLPG